MSELEKLPPEMIRLFDELLDGLLTDDGTRSLDTFLRSHVTAQRRFLDYCQLHIDLAIDSCVTHALQSFCDRQQRIAPLTTPLPPAVADQPLGEPTAAPLSFPNIPLLGWLLVLPILFGVGGWMGYSVAARKAVPAIPTKSAVVDDQMPKTPSVDAIHLDSGAATFALEKIGSVVIEGPADFQFLGPLRGRLNHGRIRVNVCEKTGQGFAVETRDGVVTDLGTEFGLEVTDHHQSGLVVFKGAVDLQIDGDRRGGHEDAVNHLVQGDAVTFEKGGAMNRVVSVITGNVATFRQGSDKPPSSSHSVIVGLTDNLHTPGANKFYEIRPDGLHENARSYVDRPYEWIGMTAQGMPTYLLGADCVKPFNDDKVRNNLEIEVALGRPAKLFVFFDRRLKPPEWLKRDFRETGDEIGMDEQNENLPMPFSIWERNVPQPGTVMLGPCQLNGEFNGTSMYGIAAVPLAGETANGSR